MATASLKSLAEDKSNADVSKLTSFRVNPDLILLEDGFNLRTDTPELLEHIDRLYKAMKAGAFVPPVDVQVDGEGKIIVREVHCRVRAARRLHSEVAEFTLECRQLRGNEQEAVLHMLGTGTGGKPLSPLEAGIGYLRLIKFGMKPNDIAVKLGVSRVTVDNGIALAEAPVEVQEMIVSGDVSATTARQAIKQGKEGVDALKGAVEAQRAAPKTKKSGKKEKVTAKKLKGTKAEKPVKPAKAKKGKAVVVETTVTGRPSTEQNLGTITPDPNTVNLSISKEVATGVFEYLRDFGGSGNASIDAMKAALETALL